MAAAAVAAVVNSNSLSLAHIRLSLLRPHLAGPLRLHRLPLAHSFGNPIKDGLYCTNSQEKNPARPCELRAVGGDGGLELHLHDAGATALVVTGAYALVSTFDKLTFRNLIQQEVYGKFPENNSLAMFVTAFILLNIVIIVPIFLTEFEQKTGPYTLWVALHGFLANFQISTSTGARYFASLVPLVNCIRLLVYGLSLANDEGLIKSVTREGKPEELLRGPLYYVIILIVSAIFFWRDSPVGVISVSMMCGGDGIADIMGRRYGSLKLPYNQEKSWAGSISMFVFGFLVSTGMLYYFSVLGYFRLEWSWTVQGVALVSLVATLVESLPITGIVDDNISVPLASMLTAFLCFGY